MSDRLQTDPTFEIPGVVTIAEGEGGLPKIIITAEDSGAWSLGLAEVYKNGATVTRYDQGGRQLLFCSRTSKYAPGKAIRGGIPVIFPWFGPHPTDPNLPQHGLVRAAEWTITSAHELPNGEASVSLTLE